MQMRCVRGCRRCARVLVVGRRSGRLEEVGLPKALRSAAEMRVKNYRECLLPPGRQHAEGEEWWAVGGGRRAEEGPR